MADNITTGVVRGFNGGISESEASGPPNSARRLMHLDIWRDPSFVSLFPKTTKISSTTMDALPTWMVDGSPFDTNRYVFSDSGAFFSLNSSDALTKLHTNGDSQGNGLGMIDNYVYQANATTLDRYGPLNGTPAQAADYIEDGTHDIDQQVTGTGNAYTLQTSINEGATHRQTMALTKDPLRKIRVNIVSKGAGDVTLTVHDSQNRLIGSVTVTNANLADATDEDFLFTTPLRINPNETYHFHLTVSTGTTTVNTGTSSDHEAVGFTAYYAVLIDADWHPMIEHNGKLLIGNERYIATQEGSIPSTYEPNRVPLGAGYSIRAFAKDDEFVVAVAVQGATNDTPEKCMLYWWEGTLDRPSFSRPFPASLVQMIHTDHKGRLVLVAGNKGTLYIGSGAAQFTKIQDAPLLAHQKKITCYPGAITEWQDKTLIGYSNTDDASFYQGVYGFGHGSGRLPEVLAHCFSISTGDKQDVDIRIGLVKAFGEDLYIGWRAADGTTFGLDKVELDDAPAATGAYRSIYIDNGNPYKEKLASTLIIVHEALGTGQQVQCAYTINRGSEVLGGYNSTTGSVATELIINSRYNEAVIGFDLIATTTYPKILAVILIWNDLSEEYDEN